MPYLLPGMNKQGKGIVLDFCVAQAKLQRKKILKSN